MRLLDRLKADVTCAVGALRTLHLTNPIVRNPTRIFPHVMTELAESYGDAPALLSDGECFSYRELAARANRYTHWARACGIAKGDVICLLMPNRPEYVAAWLGLTQAGAVVALLNTHLTGRSLAHCIDAAAPKLIIVTADLFSQLEQARRHLNSHINVWQHGGRDSDLPRIDRSLRDLPDTPLPAADRPLITVDDRALYIYTSGTTGLPKPATISHYRVMLASFGFAGIMNVKATDRMYDCLPMYHTAGGLVAIGALLVKGGSVVIRERFSAYEFWNDIERWNCTLFQYIGELCRYLVNAPSRSNETKHHLRLACGNGLRADVWREFQHRFRVPQILEFYAATEGNVAIFNSDGREGAIGRIPWFLAPLTPVKLVKTDLDSGQPIRNAQGRCVICGTNETGEAIGRILNKPSKPSARFEGYLGAADNERKILRDVLEPRDAWFRTGDLMRKDGEGYFYFVDRIGDTFRWKGENVSTWEVAETMTAFPGVVEANVYGVTIPGYDGRAGMAAVVTDRAVDLAAFHRHLSDGLPGYARPLFLRMRGEIAATSTFKQTKLDLVKQGFDPAATSDAIWFDDPRARCFVPLDNDLFKDIVTGEIRL